MNRRISCVACILLLPATIAMAEEKSDSETTKVLPGISIVGNSESPKSLTIIPWRNAQITKETKLTPSPLNEELRPVDKTVFMRELDFYSLGNPN